MAIDGQNINVGSGANMDAYLCKSYKEKMLENFESIFNQYDRHKDGKLDENDNLNKTELNFVNRMKQRFVSFLKKFEQYNIEFNFDFTLDNIKDIFARGDEINQFINDKIAENVVISGINQDYDIETDLIKEVVQPAEKDLQDDERITTLGKMIRLRNNPEENRVPVPEEGIEYVDDLTYASIDIFFKHLSIIVNKLSIGQKEYKLSEDGIRELIDDAKTLQMSLEDGDEDNTENKMHTENLSNAINNLLSNADDVKLP